MGSSPIGFDPSKLNRLRDDWKTKYTQANNFIAQFQVNRFQSTDSSDPMSKNGSIFKAEGTNGANAAQNSSSTINSNQNTTLDSADHQMPTGQVSIVTGSGQAQLASAVKDPQAGDNQGEQNDFTQKKNEAEQHVREAKDKYFSYLSEALSYDPTSSADNVFDTSSGTETTSTSGEQATSAANSDPNASAYAENQNGITDVDQNDASDPSKTDSAYQNPDNPNYQDDITQQVMKAFQQLQADAQNQRSLEDDYAQLLANSDSSAA